jgi:hypothetical protein
VKILQRNLNRELNKQRKEWGRVKTDQWSLCNLKNREKEKEQCEHSLIPGSIHKHNEDSERKEREEGQKKILKEIMDEISPNLLKIKLYIQKVQ